VGIASLGAQYRGSGRWKSQWDPGAKPQREVWGRSPPEAKAHITFFSEKMGKTGSLLITFLKRILKRI